MIRSFRSEFLKLQRPGMLLGGAGTMLGLTVLITILMFATASETPPTPQAGQQGGLPFSAFENAEGFVFAFTLVGQLLGVVALVLFAQGMGAEYGYGTLKVLLSREPRRMVILGGKVTAMMVFVLGATLIAACLGLGTSAIMAAARGIDTSTWNSAAAWQHAIAVVARIGAATVAWGIIGTLLAILFRSAPAAIGLGLGYTLVGESLLAFALPKIGRFMPGQVLGAWVDGGPTLQNPNAIELQWAAVLLVVYVAAFAIIAAVVLRNRDVAT